MTKRNKRRHPRVEPSTSPETSAAQAAAAAPPWSALQGYNALPAARRAEALPSLGLRVTDPDVVSLLVKSHFVIPGETRFECQRCGECCRYARRVAQLTYEPCPFLTSDDTCSKHDERYQVCEWFPFWVLERPGGRPLLTIKPFCTGYAKGPLVDYDATLERIQDLARSAKEDPDGASVIHEVLLIPGRNDWVFPSRANIDELIRQIRLQTHGAPQPSPEPASVQCQGEVHYAQHYTSGLLGAASDPMLTVDEHGRITDVNEAVCRVFGREARQLFGQALASFFVNPDRVEARLKSCYSRGKDVAAPQRLAQPDGTKQPVLLDAITYRSRTDGLVHGALVCVKLVSPAVFAELNQSHEYARGLLEASLDALMVIDRDGTVIDVNEAVAELTGRSRSRLIGSPFASLFASPERARAGVASTFAAGKTQMYELELLSQHGPPIEVSLNAAVYRDAEGVVQGIFAAARDIRERKRLIRQLEEAKNYARGLIECSIDLMVTIDRNGIITDANGSASAMTGRSIDRIVGHPFREFFDDPVRAQRGVELTFEKGEVRNYDLNLLTAGSKKVATAFNASIYRDARGEVQGVFAIARPV